MSGRVPLLPQEIIRRKRDGLALAPGQIEAFIGGLGTGAVTSPQVAAFTMAVFLRGMSVPECVTLTRAMTASGTTLDWTSLDLPGPVLDKHSTGGVGDAVSLLLAPAIAACGGFVPMISGRGLGHTGGTLDKLDSIPGYNTRPDLALLRRAVREAGAAIIGQTDDLAPADRTLYAVRDVTATVESIPLITASILSKKLAAGLSGLVMDVKTGSGAFMASIEGARELARSIVEVASGAGLPTRALITDMDQPLAPVAGNALEVALCLDVLAGRRTAPRLMAVTLALGAEMLVLGGLAGTLAEAGSRLEAAFAEGHAAERFARMISVMGGPSDLLDHPDRCLAAAPVLAPTEPVRPGFVQAVDTRAIGLAVVALGGGRTRVEDAVDPSVGLTELAEIGAEVGPGRPLAVVHARSSGDAERAAAAVRQTYTVGDQPGQPRPVLLDTVSR